MGHSYRKVARLPQAFLESSPEIIEKKGKKTMLDDFQPTVLDIQLNEVSVERAVLGIPGSGLLRS